MAGFNLGTDIIVTRKFIITLQSEIAQHIGVTNERVNKNKYLGLKTCGAPKGRPKPKLLASNGAHICHAI